MKSSFAFVVILASSSTAKADSGLRKFSRGTNTTEEMCKAYTDNVVSDLVATLDTKSSLLQAQYASKHALLQTQLTSMQSQLASNEEAQAACLQALTHANNPSDEVVACLVSSKEVHQAKWDYESQPDNSVDILNIPASMLSSPDNRKISNEEFEAHPRILKTRRVRSEQSGKSSSMSYSYSRKSMKSGKSSSMSYSYSMSYMYSGKSTKSAKSGKSSKSCNCDDIESRLNQLENHIATLVASQDLAQMPMSYSYSRKSMKSGKSSSMSYSHSRKSGSMSYSYSMSYMYSGKSMSNRVRRMRRMDIQAKANDMKGLDNEEQVNILHEDVQNSRDVLVV